MNILLSTTRQWNPGDEFIYRGVRRLIEAHVPKKANWFLWDRNPDLFVDQWSNMRPRAGRLGNSISEPIPAIFDLIILAGSPEWTGPSVAPLYDYAEEHPRTSFLALGVGSGWDTPPLLSALERRVLERENSLVLTRSRQLADTLQAISERIGAAPLPCPSLFCADALSTWNHAGGVVAILQETGTGMHARSAPLLDDVQRCIDASAEPIDVLAFYALEAMPLKTRYPNRLVRYEGDAYRIPAIYNDYSAVVTTRLHGALSAVSHGVPSIVLTDQDFRVESTLELFSTLVPCLDAEEAFCAAHAIDQEERLLFGERVQAFKQETWEQYKFRLDAFFIRTTS